MKPVVIIPALNPDEKLIELAEGLREAGLKIVVVNDGSSRQCDEIFQLLKTKYNCDICIHKINMGKGAALKTGIRFAAFNYPDSCGYVTADADGQHAPCDIVKVAAEVEKNPHCLILGSRDFSERNVPFKSRWGNRITSLVFKLSTGQKCPDTQTGLRGIPAKYTKQCLAAQGDKFEYEMNMLMEFGKTGIAIVHVPIATIYLENNKFSHFHPMRDSVLIYFNILKYSISSLVCAMIDLTLFTVFMNLVFSDASAGIIIATIIARVMSGYVNFMLNKHWVFGSKNSNKMEMLKYSVLFCSQMMLSGFFVTVLSHISVHLTLIKILVDSTLFFLSYQIQKNFIFQKRKDLPSNEKVFS